MEKIIQFKTTEELKDFLKEIGNDKIRKDYPAKTFFPQPCLLCQALCIAGLGGNN